MAVKIATCWNLLSRGVLYRLNSITSNVLRRQLTQLMLHRHHLLQDVLGPYGSPAVHSTLD